MSFFMAKFTRTQCDPENYGTITTKVIGDWQIKSTDIKMRMENLFYSDSWTDCTFSFEESQSVSAHKVVLAASSPVFAAMFFNGWPENGSPIHVEDIEPETFTKMLRYIYTDNIDITVYNDAVELYYAAKKYMLLHLKAECLNYLRTKLTAEDCCLAYEFAQMVDENDLLDDCEKFMQTNTNEILTTTGFLKASVKTVYYIYSQNTLNVTDELDLFEALERYAEFNDECGKLEQNNMCENNQINGLPNEKNDIQDTKQEIKENGSLSAVEKYDKTRNGEMGDCVVIVDSNLQKIAKENGSSQKEFEETKDETVKDSKSEWITIRHVVKLIRFLTMSAEEFSSLPASSSLLTQTEVLSILINIINHNKSKVPMPEGFSTMMENRCPKNSIEEISASRKSIKFDFTVPDCRYLECGDEINFPQLYCVDRTWKVCLTLTNDDCEVTVTGTGPDTYKFILKLSVITKQGTAKRYKFDSDDKEPAEYLGSIAWNDIMNKYVENAAVCFRVEINPYTEIKYK